MSAPLRWVLLVTWAVLLLLGLMVYSQRQLSFFDPQGILLHASTNATFDETVVRALKNQGITGASIVHVGPKNDCYCDTLTKPHQAQLQAKLRVKGYRATQLNLEHAPELKALISSVPALIIIDSHAQLRYLGPYAIGYGCLTGNTLVEAISQYASARPYPGAIINADASGCFCQA